MALIADIYVNPLYIVLLGVVTGVMNSAFRVGGALVTVPFLIMLKVPVVTIVATQPFIMLSGAILSVLNNYKNIDFSKTALKINLTLTFGLVIGVFFGYEILKKVSKINNFELYYSYVYMLVTSFFGALIVKQSFSLKEQDYKHVNLAEINYKKTRIINSGILSSVFSVMLGLGGNVFLMPLLTSYSKLPISFIKNNSYLSLAILTFISSVFSFVQLTTFDFMLAFLTIIGIFVGIFVGSVINNHISYNKTRIVPGLMLLIITFVMFYKKVIL